MREETLTRALRRYDASPHLVFWETTKACPLACRHCRASAQCDPLPEELSTREGLALLDQVAALPGQTPIVVFTGGDCLARADIFELIAYARTRGLRVGVAPSVSDALDEATISRLYDAGVRAVSISLDGAGPASHDGLRGIPGHFDATIATLRTLVRRGFRVQVNTTVTSTNVTEMADVAVTLRDLGVKIWEVFFLVGVGRGVQVSEVSAWDAEDVCHFLVDASAGGLTVRTVEAPFFRRVQAERARLDEDPGAPVERGALYEFLRERLDAHGWDRSRPAASNSLATGDGRGVIFVGHDGEVHASGFLPLALGNVRDEPLGSIYAMGDLLTRLRSGALTGVCGECEYRRLCGGSRARAYAHSRDPLGDDPSCVRTHRASLTLSRRAPVATA